MRFPQHFIERVRQSDDLVSLIEEDTALKGSGDRLMGLCPFPDHTEKTPSFSVSRDKQVYYCFGCMKSGNIFTYLRDQRGMDFPSAVEFLAGKAGIPFPRDMKQERRSFQNAGDLFKLNKKACDFYHRQLLSAPADHPARKYLKERAYAEDTIRDFQLGYAPRGNSLFNHLTSAEKEGALRLGLLSQSDGNEKYDTYRHRLMFPILSSGRRVTGFGARVLDDSLPKYINSKESDIFHKGRSFYGLDHSLRFLRQEGTALIVEGYTDFLSLWQRGIKNMTATLGTALTLDQARLLKRYVHSVTLIFDGDFAGSQAGRRSLPLLLSAGLEVRGITLPEGQDPDQFIKTRGAEALTTLIHNSEDMFFQILREALEGMKRPGGDFFYLIDEVAPFLQATQNETLRSLYRQRILDIFGNDAGSFSKELDRVCRSSRKKTEAVSAKAQDPSAAKAQDPSSSQKENRDKPSLAALHQAERLLLVLCLDSEDFLKNFISLSGIQLIKTSWVADLFQEMERNYGQSPKKFDTFLASMMDRVCDGRLLLRDSHISLTGDTSEREKIFKDCLLFLRKNQELSEADRLVAEMKMTGKGNLHDLEKVFHLTKKRLTRRKKTAEQELS